MSASLASGYHQGTKNRLARLRRATRVVLAARGCQKSPRRTCGAQTNAYTAPACMGMHAWACTPMCSHMHAPWTRRVSSHCFAKGGKKFRPAAPWREAKCPNMFAWALEGPNSPRESRGGVVLARSAQGLDWAPWGSGAIEHPRFRNLRCLGPLGP